MSRFALLVGAMVFSAPVWAATIRYKFPNHPKNDLGCHTTAAELGARFTEGSGLPEVISRCLSETKEGYQIEVTYEAEEKLPMVSTAPRLGISDSLGRYASREACEKALGDERVLFQDETKLSPSVYFCAQDRASDKTSWHVFLLAFGKATRSFWVSSFSIFGLPVDLDGVQYKQQLFQELKKRGVTPLSLVSRSQLAYGDVSLTYYGEIRERLDMNEYTQNKTVEQCKAQIEPARAIFTDSKNPPVLVYCARASVGSTPELNVLFFGEAPYRSRPSTEKFQSYDECESKRAALVDYYTTKLKLPVKGGLCSRRIEDDNKYVVILFESAGL